MNGIIEFLTTEEMIVVYFLIAIASVLYFVIYLLDKTYEKRKRRHNTKELQKIVDATFPEEKKKIEEPVLTKVETLSVEEPQKKEVVTPVIEPMVVEKEKVEVPVIEKMEEEKVEPIIITPEVTPQEVVIEQPKVEEEKVEKQQPKQEELQYTSIEPDRLEAQEELMRLTETLEKAEQEVKNIELTAFEEEQEQNAIISLDELMARGKTLYESGELEKLEDEGNEPISIQDLEARMKAVKEEANKLEEPIIIEKEEEKNAPVVLDDLNTVKVEEPVYQEHKKFKSSPVISPVFGIESPRSTASEIELENTANYEKLDEEIRKTNEFLMTLKELQKKLD